MLESGPKTARFPVPYIDGINSTVSPTMAKRTELSHAENARSPQIGVIEKRKGQTVTGTSPNGNRFIATENYGITRFTTTNSAQQGVFRLSTSSEPTQTVSVSVYDHINVVESVPSGSFSSPTYSIAVSTTTFQTMAVDYVTITEPSFVAPQLNDNTIRVMNSVSAVNIYYLSATGTWVKLSDTDAQSIPGGQFDYAVADQNLVIVNQNAKNRLLSSDGSTVTTSTDAGSLYNSPPASKACFYKKRIHLADFISNGVRYPTSVVRSSYPLGIIALVNGDHAASPTTPLNVNVTDTKYFYSASGMNSYDVYRGGTKIETITVSAVNETTVTVPSTSNAFNSSDEIWIAGTYAGAKQFRWVNNPTGSGRDVKQYDTFKLSGGDEDPITLFDTIGNVIMIGNHYSLATWDDYTLQAMDINVGCSSRTGSAKLLGTLYFIHYGGIYATTGSVPTLISRKVQRYIDGATRDGLEAAAAGVKGLSVFFAIGDVTLYKEDGSIEKTLTDTCLEYNVADQNWYVHTNVPIAEFVNFISADGVEHLYGTHGGNAKSVVDFLSGNTDDGSEIFFRADSQELQLVKEFEAYSNPLGIISDIRRGSQMKIYVSTDGEDFYALEGSPEKGVTTVKINDADPMGDKGVLCRRIKISYRDASKQLCRLNQFAILYAPTPLEKPSR